MGYKGNLIELFRMAKDASSSGGSIFSNLGLNAYNLETKAKSLIPYNAPFYKSTPRVTSDVGGTSVHWKAVLTSSPGIVSLPEALRAAPLSFLEKDYNAPFKTTGVEVSVSSFAQQAGRSFEDNLGFAQFSALQTFLRAQDQQLLCDGNSGPTSVTGGNGFALGTTPTPVVSVSAGGSITASTNISVVVVALTNYGYRGQNDASLNTQIVGGVVKGLTPQFSLTNATGTTITASGGTAIASAVSNIASTTSSNKTLTIVIPQTTGGNVGANAPGLLGAPAYAVYIDTTDASSPADANLVFLGIFNTNTIVLSTNAQITPAGSSQNLADSSAAALLTTDYSYDANQVDSYLAWALNWNGSNTPSGYSGFSSYYADLGGASLSGDGAGGISQFITIGAYLYDKYKSAPDRILCAAKTVSGTSLKAEIQKQILNPVSGSNANPAGRYNFDFDTQTKKVSGTSDWSYDWVYSYDGSSTNIDIEVMPWLAPGQIIFQTTKNPYPQFSGVIPAAFEVHCLLDTFSVLWPVVQYEQSMGIANFTATKSYLPHVAAVLQNVG